jgi:hypothetical protein
MQTSYSDEVEAIAACGDGPPGCEVLDRQTGKWLGPTCMEEIDEARAVLATRRAVLEDERPDVPACERGCLSWSGCDEPGEHCSATNQPTTPEGEKARGDVESLNAERLAVARTRMHASTEGASA